MKITALRTDHLRVPLVSSEASSGASSVSSATSTTARPARIPLSDPAPTPVVSGATPATREVVVVHLDTDAGLTGLGFALLDGPGAVAVRSLLDGEVSPLLLGQDPREPERLFARAEAHFRSVGFVGLAARAYAAVDLAVWDLKSKLAGVPLFRLLGGARTAAPFFVSDLSGDVVSAARSLLKQGAMGVRVEIGGGDVSADADAIRELAEGLGEAAWLGVSGAGRFDLPTAVALARFLADLGVDWFEDPLPAADEPGYATLAARTDLPLAAGAGFATREAFFRLIRVGHARTARPDVMRLGGITPVLKVAAVAEAFQVAVSPVRLPEVGVHLACGLGVVPHVDVGGWLRDIFTGGPRVEAGRLVPPSEPGLGLSLEPGARVRWSVGRPS